MKTNPGMTTWEYAHELQARSFGAKFDHVDAGWCDVLAANILGALPTEHRRMLDRVPIIVLPTKNPNAMIILAPDGGHIIAIDYGLVSLLTTLNKIVLCRLSIFGLEPNIDYKASAEMAHNSVTHFLGADSQLARWPVPPRKMSVASALGNIQTAFVVGHEIGHLVLGHLKGNDKIQLLPNFASPLFPGDAKPAVSNVFEEHAFKAFVNGDMHQQEIDADRRGAELVLNHFRKTYDPLFGDNEAAYAHAAIDILFSYFDYIAHAANMPQKNPTHPPAHERKAKLREYLWQDLPDASRKLAAQFEEIVGSFKLHTDEVQSKGQNHKSA